MMFANNVILQTLAFINILIQEFVEGLLCAIECVMALSLSQQINFCPYVAHVLAEEKPNHHCNKLSSILNKCYEGKEKKV